MKNRFKLSVALLGLIALAVPSHAQIITSIQFGDSSTTVVGANSAGVSGYSVSDWNEVTTGPASAYTQTFSAPVNFNLATTTAGTGTITGSVYSAGNFDQSAPGAGGTFTAGDDALAGYGGTSEVTLTLNGLNAGDTYELIGYVTDQGTSLVTATATDGSTTGTEYFGDGTGGMNTYVQGSSTSSPLVQANYVEYTGLTGATSLTLNLQEAGSNFFGLNGVQLVDTTTGGSSPSVPEPSTVWLFSFGILGLGLHLYRKRWAKI